VFVRGADAAESLEDAHQIHLSSRRAAIDQRECPIGSNALISVRARQEWRRNRN